MITIIHLRQQSVSTVRACHGVTFTESIDYYGAILEGHKYCAVVRMYGTVEQSRAQYSTAHHTTVQHSVNVRTYHHIREGGEGNVWLSIGQAFVDLVTQYDKLYIIIL